MRSVFPLQRPLCVKMLKYVFLKYSTHHVHLIKSLSDIQPKNQLPRNSNTRILHHTMCWKLYQRGLRPPIVVVCGSYGVIN